MIRNLRYAICITRLCRSIPRGAVPILLAVLGIAAGWPGGLDGATPGGVAPQRRPHGRAGILHRLEIDRTRSHLALRTYRGGLLSFLGHDHGVLATAWRAELCLDPETLPASTVTITLPVDSLVIDTPEARQLAGLDRHGGPGPADREKLQQKMLSAEVLDPVSHPEITFRSSAVEAGGAGNAVEVTGELAIHGITRTVMVPVAVDTLDDGALRLSGQLEIRHSWFGLKAESVAGVVNVKDEMELRFELVGRPSDQVCGA